MPTLPPRPHADLTHATPEEIAAISQATWDDWRTREHRREAAIKRLLRHLAQFPGETWQQRWEASGLDDPGHLVRDLERAEDRGRSTLTGGLEALLCLRVIRPSLPAMRSNKFLTYAKTFRTAQDDPLLDVFFKQVATSEASRIYQSRALFDVCCALTTQGIALVDLTPEAFLFYAKECRELAGVVNTSTTRFTGHLAWEVLHEMEHFPPKTPRTLRTALRAGRLSVSQLVHRYPVAHPEIAQLFVDYLTRRQPGLDYTSLEGLSRELVSRFWCAVEKISPGEADLRLSEETYQQWRTELKFKPDGSPRLSQDITLMAVRAFYYDLQAWAAEQPEQWARWVAPCPIRDPETREKAARRRRNSERIADRTRRRQPLLPALVEHVGTKYARLAELLAAGAAAAPGEVITVDGRSYQKVFTDTDRRRQTEFGQAHVRVRDQATGKVINVSRKEQKAFWEWVIVETLRHSGARVEELLELSQLSIRQYQRPNGEVVALLVIAPSKTDRERVIPMSAELFHVIAAIIRRHTQDRATIPLVSRFDPHDKETSSPQPFLFQRVVGPRREVFSSTAVVDILGQLCKELAERRPEFAEAKFTPHDFRRLLATDLVNSGLPIHIVQRYSDTSILEPLGATSRSSRKTSSATIRPISPGAASYVLTTNTGRPATRSGASSRNTSTNVRSSSATAGDPTEPLARMSTLVSGVPSCRSTRRCCPALTNLKRTCSPAETEHRGKAGSASSKVSTSPSPSSGRNASRPSATAAPPSYSDCPPSPEQRTKQARNHDPT